MSTNTNEFTQIEQKYELTEESKQKFWSKVSPYVRQKSQEAGYDPNDYILWNGQSKTWYFHEADLINWLKIVYPNSIIQTEKAMLELGSYCQYRVKIWLDPTNQEIPNIFEGPVIIRDESDFFTGERNYIATARTMAVGNALRHCGFGSQVNDEYVVLPNNNSVQNQQINHTQSNQVYKTSNDTEQVTLTQQTKVQPIDVSKITVDEAANCPVEYKNTYSGRKYCEHVQLGKYLNVQPDSAPRFFKAIVNTPDMCTEYTQACASVLLAQMRPPTPDEAAKYPLYYVENSSRTKYLGEPIGKILEVDKAFLDRAVNSKSVDIKSKRAIKVLLDSVNAK